MVTRLQAILAEDVTLRVDEFAGRFRVSPRSHLFQRIAQSGRYEPELAGLFLSALDPARDVIDVGANVGFFTVAGAKRLTTGRVLAIEPTAGAFARLTTNISLNGVGDKVIAFNGLASAENGEAELHAIEGMEEYSSMQALVHPSVAQESGSTVISTASRTIDSLVDEHGLKPSLIKVDVEGAEGLVFKGAEQTLKRFRPVIISELSNALLRGFGTSAAEIVAMLEGLDYEVSDPFDPKALPGTKEFGDIICRPRSPA